MGSAGEHWILKEYGKQGSVEHCIQKMSLTPNTSCQEQVVQETQPTVNYVSCNLLFARKSWEAVNQSEKMIIQPKV